jgi:hypothetical protein
MPVPAVTTPAQPSPSSGLSLHAQALCVSHRVTLALCQPLLLPGAAWGQPTSLRGV